MDLYAYAQIGDLEKIAKENEIIIPRLRGYRLMGNESPLTKDEIDEIKRQSDIEVAEKLCMALPAWSLKGGGYLLSRATDRIRDKYLIRDFSKSYRQYVGIRWDRIHGKKRRTLKYAIKLRHRKIQAQFDMWNKYAGRADVLYIHSRMGGNNWKYYDGKESIVNAPWFLDRVDDNFDRTYCDFYAQIKLGD